MDANERQAMFRGRPVLAPLTKGGNLPFRRLLVELGCEVTTSEMAVAQKVRKRMRGEMVLLRRAPEETCFGVQLAGRKPDQLADAARVAEDAGASFVDLNLGCPIDVFCRRGMGAALLQRPRKVAQIVAAMREAISIPLSVKIRLGWEEDKPTYPAVAQAVEDNGADALTVHGRSRKQRYRRAADWDAIAEVVDQLSIPVLGNGDLLTWRDVERRWKESGCAGVMLARGALIKPWIFLELQAGRDLILDAAARRDILRRYRDLAMEHFGDDEHGLRRVEEFLTWHLGLFNRYRPVPSEAYGEDEHPLIQTRVEELPPDAADDALLYSVEEEDRQILTRQLLDERRDGGAPFAGDLRSAILAKP